MRTLIRGKIEDFVPTFNAYLDNEGNIVLDEYGDFHITVDTGFNGGIALPMDIITDNMNLELVGFELFRIATGEIIELPVFLGKAIIKDYKLETWFIPGDYLLGLEFLSIAGRILSLDFDNKTVKLEI
jgi:predicted aspartyl protease